MVIYDIVKTFIDDRYILVKVDVEEKPKTFKVVSSEDSSAYGYSSRIYKEDAFLTPMAAINDKIDRKRKTLDAKKNMVVKMESELEELINLKHELSK